MRVSAVNRQYLGQNTSRNHPPESAAGRAANQAHPPRAARTTITGGCGYADEQALQSGPL
jgi:hypothetical protein